jgi:hypothetical protein
VYSLLRWRSRLGWIGGNIVPEGTNDVAESVSIDTAICANVVFAPCTAFALFGVLGELRLALLAWAALSLCVWAASHLVLPDGMVRF